MPADTINVLNQLLQLHSRSLPTYLTSARPWMRRSDEEAMETLDQIAHDHSRMVDRLANSIMSHRGTVAMGEFPMEFTDLHDLSVSYLLRTVADKQTALVGQIQACVDQLDSEPMAKALAEEALGEAKGHLDTLREVMNGEVRT